MSTITRKAIATAAAKAHSAREAGNGYGAAIEAYVKATDRAARDTEQAREVHAAHAALAAALYVDSVSDDFRTKAGKPKVTPIWEDLHTRGVVSVQRSMFSKRVTAGSALVERGFTLADVEALEADALAAYRDAQQQQRSDRNRTDDPRNEDGDTGRGTEQPVAVTGSEPTAPSAETAPEVEEEHVPSAGEDILALAERLQRNISSGVAFTEPERVAIREALETALAALEVSETVAA